MEFLLSTGRVSSDAFDRALMRSVTSKRPEVVPFLCSKKRASPSAINGAFQASCKREIIKYLYENEDISSAAVIAALKKAAKCGQCPRAPYNADDIAIVKLLHKDDRIPVEVMEEVLMSAASTNESNVVEVLRRDDRISAEVSRAALAMARNVIAWRRSMLGRFERK
ncbi:hypothetical protein PR003_g6711 [Phytophthora rubi]|uniref:Ankyrin repeat protein n=1 Tax=Phytophthora rubi TaxID=129364 RepID=A0A6A3NEX1_9STRA|nr:hypothetical protein PR002_g6824 [Phytophthora rubi]KAE9041891.1 hypothetical protein PR001_g6436 [Phytophthora rubi]KAE9347850.1 hypothetical protein PR003_g6711 [Phytophthora rubi]